MSESRKKIQLTHNLITSYSMKIVLITTIIIATWKSEWIWVIGCIAGILITFSPSIIKRNIKIMLPWPIELLIATVAALNMIGVLLSAYYTIPGFPQFVDFLTSILVAFLAFALIYIIDEYWDGLNMDKYAMAFVVVTTTMASCVVLEFIKWFKIFGAKQSSVEGVLISLLVGTIGGFVTAFIGVNLIKKGKFDTITQDFGKQIDTAIIERIK
jgi:hypothetical protein